MNTSLPIYHYKEEIVNTVANYPVTVIVAETGSGKSTQVPQFLYDAGNKNIVVTEPRRMASWSLGQRVSKEMNCQLGSTVGFETAFEKNTSDDTSILYCTDGLELNRLLSSKNGNIDVLIIDEVHEWNQNIENIVALINKKVAEGWSTKVVIMSATLEKDTFSEYFKENVCILDVPGSLFPVSFEERYKSDLIPSIKEMVSLNRNTLVFVPGKAEIEDVIKDLATLSAVVLPLHGEQTSDEQSKCFESYSLPKVIVATNVAQTSITIPDIDAVVDTGKERRFEVHNGIESIFLTDISQSDCLQRKGRAGRTKEGIYILCSNTPFEARDKYPIPEIQRGLLDQTFLRLATHGIDALEYNFFHQPSTESLLEAKKTLINLGALTNDGEVTPIGYKMAKMPVSVSSARMIIEAEKYGVTEDVIKIASILEIQSLLGKDASYHDFSDENNCDLLAELDMWNTLTSMKYIDFKELHINKKIFYRIKEHMNHMFEALDGLVEISSSGNRNDIKKCCIAGMLHHLYTLRSDYFSDYSSDTGMVMKLNKRSCLGRWDTPQLLVGIPRKIEFLGQWGIKQTMDIITMVTKVSVQDLINIAPHLVTHKYFHHYYSCSRDVVVATKIMYLRDIEISREEVEIPNHPDYEKLKEECLRNSNYYSNKRQQTVTIDGKIFEVHHSYFDPPYIVVDDFTLFNTNVRTVLLDNGTRVMFKNIHTNYENYNMISLRNAVELYHIKKLWTSARNNLPKIKNTLISILENASIIGKTEIGRDNGGYGDIIYGFISLSLNGSSLHLELLDDEEKANKKNQEALEFLYGKIIRENYSEKRFKFKKGVKGLSPKEQKVKAEFDSEVRELQNGLELSNIEERLSYLKELYELLIEDLKIVA